MGKLENVSVVTEANVYFDGQCISHTCLLPDGTRKSIGVIFPSTLTFNTAAPEVMEVVKGECRVRQAGEGEARTYKAGEEFRVPAESSFEIQVVETLHYVCHYG